MNQNSFFPGTNNSSNFTGAPIFTGSGNIPNQQTVPTMTGDFPMEQSYIENILRLNKGKKVKVYASYPDSNEWRDKIYEGIIEQSGRDHLILSDPTTGNWYLLKMLYVNYIEFNEKINYNPDYSDTFD